MDASYCTCIKSFSKYHDRVAINVASTSILWLSDNHEHSFGFWAMCPTSMSARAHVFWSKNVVRSSIFSCFHVSVGILKITPGGSLGPCHDLIYYSYAFVYLRFACSPRHMITTSGANYGTCNHLALCTFYLKPYTVNVKSSNLERNWQKKILNMWRIFH